jgi:alpha-amylase
VIAADLPTQMNITAMFENELLIAKPPLFSLLSNRGSSGSTNTTISSSSSGWPAQTTIIDAITCNTYTTDSSGNLAVSITGGMPLVLLDQSKKGNLCDGKVKTGTGGTSGAAASVKLGLIGWVAGLLVVGGSMLL